MSVTSINIHPMNFFLLLFALLITSNLKSEIEPKNLLDYRVIDYDFEFIPEQLLATRTVVFVHLENENKIRGPWKKLAEKAHNYFYKLGIDPIAYYYLDDVLAGPEVTKAIAGDLIKRKVENIIFLKRDENKVFSVTITEFNQKENLVSNGQKAWKNQNDELEKVMINLYRTIGKKNYEKKNLLILETPAFYKDTQIISGRRFESYQQDLKLDKLAVPLYQKIELPDNISNSNENNQVIKNVKLHNNNIAAENDELSRIMQQYPFEYEIIDTSNKTDAQLIADGFQFVFMRIHSTGKAIKELLDYETSPSETDYVTLRANSSGDTNLITYPVDLNVYKFYIKHLYTGDTFLGSKWDADTTWTSALKNYIENMKIDLKPNQ